MRYTRALIFEQNLRHNFRELKKFTNSSRIMSLVKANGYGHGIVECAKILEDEGTDFFGVAFPEEGVRLRQAGIKKPILVLVAPSVEDVGLFADYELQTVGVSFKYLKLISDYAESVNKKVKAHLFITTGMHRDGIRGEDANDFLNKASELNGIEFVGVCTHFATSETKDTSFAKEQLTLFQIALKELEDKGWKFDFIHAANSAALINFPESRFNLVRPGISLYGYNTSELYPDAVNLKPVMHIVTKVSLMRTIYSGESVGYGRKFVADRKTNIAVVPIGYGDGFAYHLTNKAQCLIRGLRYNFVGSVCMDESMINVGDDDILPGEDVVLIGNQGDNSIFADEIADIIGTIPYEILTSIQDRVPRIVVNQR